MNIVKNTLHEGAINALQELNFSQRQIAYIAILVSRFNFLEKEKSHEDYGKQEMRALNYMMHEVTGVSCELLRKGEDEE